MKLDGKELEKDWHGDGYFATFTFVMLRLDYFRHGGHSGLASVNCGYHRLRICKAVRVVMKCTGSEMS